MSKYTVEKGDEKDIPINRLNLFLSNITDMEHLEYWEDRLDYLKQPYVIAFKKHGTKVVYSIFTKIRKKESAFK